MLSEFVSFYFSALPKIIKAGFAALQLEYFFTAGPDEVRAWTIRVRVILIHQLHPFHTIEFRLISLTLKFVMVAVS